MNHTVYTVYKENTNLYFASTDYHRALKEFMEIRNGMAEKDWKGLTMSKEVYASIHDCQDGKDPISACDYYRDGRKI